MWRTRTALGTPPSTSTTTVCTCAMSVEPDHTHYAGLKHGHAKFVPRGDCYACVPVPRSQYAWQANANNQLIFATDGAEHTCAA